MKYDIIYSLGQDCACAMYMIKHNLRSCSGPFDWLTNSDFSTRCELILNNFNNFLNIEDFEFMEKNPKIFNDEKCDYYKNKKTNFAFFHDFPTGIDIKESLPAVKEKYDRRIKRFYDNIKNNNKILFIYFSQTTITDDETILKYSKEICNKFNKSIDFLIIEHKENIINPEKVKLSNNIVRYYVHALKKDEKGNNTTTGYEERINPIFKQYKLIQPLSLLIKKNIKKILVNLNKFVFQKKITTNNRLIIKVFKIPVFIKKM